MPIWQSSVFGRFSGVTRLAAAGPAADIAEIRRQYARSSVRFGAVPQDVLFEPASLGPVKGEWVRAPASQSGRQVLYFHGGFYVAGAPEQYRALTARLAQAGEAEIFAPAYRLAPECIFPAAVRDGIDAYRQLLARGAAPQSIALSGDGAGGGLAFAVLLAIRNAGLAMPAACTALSPWADLTLSGWSMLQNAKSDAMLDWRYLFVSARQYLRKANPADPYASPCFASFKDFPPIMVHAGSREILRDDASRLGDRAAEAGVPVSVEIYDGMQHLFQADAHLQEARVSVARLGQFIRARTQVQTAPEPAAMAAQR